MQNDLLEVHRQKLYRRNFLIFLGACVGFYTLIYMPIYYLLSTNIVWSDSPLLLMWMELIEPLMNYAFYWGAFAFVLYAALRDGQKRALPLAGFYAAAAFLRYFTGLFSYMWIMGAIHWSSFLATDLWGLLFSLFMDCAQMALVLLAFYLMERKLIRSRSIPAHQGTIREAYLPMTRVFDWKDPLFRLSFIAASVPAALQILSRIYYDLDLILIRGMEISGVGEVIVILSYYITDIATAFLGALILSMLLNAFFRADEKRREADEKQSEELED